MNKITTTTNAKQGKLYAGPAPLPQGAKLIGTVTRDSYDTGALVELANGRQVQYNAGVLRNLPGVMGRPPMSAAGNHGSVTPGIWDTKLAQMTANGYTVKITTITI